mmetsp:Transcript_106589/g.195310  ORF Transcript_106589/g.195310 Transcript_106589/m.195310 type:complete len:243 (-) Transcript_106589:88-816(-)
MQDQLASRRLNLLHAHECSVIPAQATSTYGADVSRAAPPYIRMKTNATAAPSMMHTARSIQTDLIPASSSPAVAVIICAAEAGIEGADPQPNSTVMSPNSRSLPMMLIVRRFWPMSPKAPAISETEKMRTMVPPPGALRNAKFKVSTYFLMKVVCVPWNQATQSAGKPLLPWTPPTYAKRPSFPPPFRYDTIESYTAPDSVPTVNSAEQHAFPHEAMSLMQSGDAVAPQLPTGDGEANTASP